MRVHGRDLVVMSPLPATFRLQTAPAAEDVSTRYADILEKGSGDASSISFTFCGPTVRKTKVSKTRKSMFCFVFSLYVPMNFCKKERGPAFDALSTFILQYDDREWIF